MDYKKGDRIAYEDQYYYYLDEFFDEELQTRILVCGGDGPFFTHIPEDEAEVVDDVSDQQKMLDVLVDVATSLKCLGQDIREALEILNPEEEMCDECRAAQETEDDGTEGNTEKKLN